MYRTPCLLIAAFSFALINSAKSDTLYDVTFSAPDYTAGQPSITGTGPNAPSQNVFGTSVVATNIGGHDQALLLAPQNIGSFIYSQYSFSTPLTPDQKYLRTSFDIFVEKLAAPANGSYVVGPDDGFGLLFDTPSVVRLDFTGNGDILENNNSIGQFSNGTWNRMTIDIDFTTNSWAISQNSLLLDNSTFFHPYPASPDAPTTVQSVRMNLSDNMNLSGSPIVYLDNIFIASSDTPFTTSTVPESANSMALLGFSVFGLVIAKTAGNRRRNPE